MRALIVLAGAALALGACGRDDAETADTNALTGDNLMIEDNAAMPGGMDGNMETNADTENMMMNDMTTNDADTNLANGL